MNGEYITPEVANNIRQFFKGYETKQNVPPKPRKTYRQDWPMYNLAQTKEKVIFMKLLNSAVDSLAIPYQYHKNGRPPLPIGDMIKCCCIKVFNGFSARRSIYDITIAHAYGYIWKIPHFNSLINYMQNPELTPWLHKLYIRLSQPLIPFETVFAADATGFSTFNKKKWVEVRKEKFEHRDYRKLHATCGVKTNIITSAEVSEGRAHDVKFFKKMVRETAVSFNVEEFSADPAYLSKENCLEVEKVGGVPFILPRKNTRYSMKGSPKDHSWNRMVSFWLRNYDKFMRHYHKRSNVESTFGMIKRKYLSYVRSKLIQAQFNEMLCKVVCHNCSVLVHSIFELSLRPDFDKFSRSAPSVTPM